jgi:hypothetical protein
MTIIPVGPKYLKTLCREGHVLVRHAPIKGRNQRLESKVGLKSSELSYRGTGASQDLLSPGVDKRFLDKSTNGDNPHSSRKAT